jgi:cytochrome b involved in lipid metabolism
MESETKVVPLARITPTELAKHNTKEDAWIAIQGKVYNVTAYVSRHPGFVSWLISADRDRL